jgi:geranylgeranyl pyrophosphate synthase
MQVSPGISLSNIYQPIEKELETVKENLIEQLRDAFDLIQGLGFEETVVGGKQIRPALALLSGLSISPANGDMLTGVAVASEMTHFASLIHDDVVDGATTRRGTESVNARWHDKIAVLLGDYIIAQALFLLGEYRDTGMLHTIITAMKEMSEGELHQMTASANGPLSEAEYYSIIKHKTSSLMGAVCKMPAQITGGTPEVVDAMYGFGHNFGMAFQIVDDLLDFVADERKLGKPVFCDIMDGKATLPTICMLERLNKGDADRIRGILKDRRLGQSDKAWLCDAIRDCSADEYCAKIAGDFASTAKHALEAIPDSEYKRSMLDLCDHVVARDK